ncbi:MAG: hypothetical protein ABGY09_07980 [Euryarchaeota archaeon]
MPPLTRRGVDALALASLALISLVFLTEVPLHVPLTPYLYASGVANLKAVAESLRARELPEWNPYLGGGYPLTPTPYYLLYGLGKWTLIPTLLALSAWTYRAWRSRFLATLASVTGLATSLYTLSPAPALLFCYLAGLTSNSPARRTLGSLSSPELALSVELSLRRASPWPILVSASCVADDILALPHPTTAQFTGMTLLSYLAILTAALLATSITSYFLSRTINTRWKAPTAFSAGMSAVSLLHPGAALSLAFPYTVLLSWALRRVDLTLSRLERQHRPVLLAAALTPLALTQATLAPLSTLSGPRMAVVGSVTVGPVGPEIATAIVSSDPWFTEVVRRVLRGEVVANPPSISTTPAATTLALLMRQVGDTRYLTVNPTTAPATVLPRFEVVRIVSPGRLAVRSLDQVTLATEWIRRNQGTRILREPRVITPRTLLGHGLVAQSFSPWWKPAANRRPGPGGLMILHGRVRYDRPTAPVSLLLTLVGVTAAIPARKRRTEHA